MAKDQAFSDRKTNAAIGDDSEKTGSSPTSVKLVDSQSSPRNIKSLPSYGSTANSFKPPSLKTTTRNPLQTRSRDGHNVPLQQPPVGPLARVSSRPTFVPCMQIDFDAVAEQVSEQVGGSLTTEELLNSLGDTGSSVPATESIALASRDPTETEVQENSTDQSALKVTLADGDDLCDFSDEALVLKIRSQGPFDTEGEDTSSHAIDRPPHDSDIAGGFAINIPVINDEVIEPYSTASSWNQYVSSSWTAHSPFSQVNRDLDEEDPLISHPIGIDMSYHGEADLLHSGSAVVQRHGPRDIASEQEVVYAVPNADIPSHTGLFIPVVDSKDDLQQLVLVVPPEDSEDFGKDIVEDQTTAEATREYIESFTSMIPPIVDVDSTLEVHGTVENATVAVNVTQQVSWVGYFILAIALASVASQGTAVKWLPSVDGMIAAAWLMQAQTCLMLPFAVVQVFTMNKEEKRILRDPSTLKLIAAASIAQVCWASGFFLAIDFTSLFHAWSLNNIHALAIVLITAGRIVIFKDNSLSVSYGEEHGARVAILGVVIMQIPALMSGNTTVLFGDVIAGLSSLGAILFLDLCKELRNKIPLFVMMTPISALNSVLFSVASMAIAGTDFSMSDNGALGWLKSDRIILAMYLGGVVGFLGTVSCIAALKFLPNVVVGSVQTMMPVVGTITAVVMGVDTIPDFWSTCGGGVLLYGVLLIANATRQNETTVVINSHISEVSSKKAS